MLLHNFPLTTLLLSTIPVTPQWGAVGEASLSTGLVVQVMPFTMVWNIPTARSQECYGIHLDLGVFDINFKGQNISIFYRNQLELRLHLPGRSSGQRRGSPEGRPGGPPGPGPDSDLSPAQAGLQRPGLCQQGGVAPPVVEGFGMKLEYRRLSKSLVRREYPELTKPEGNSLAHKEFERGNRAFMYWTLRLGVCLRPRGLWGFYGFPECFNHHRKQKGHSYTGHRHPKTRQKNDQLAWLWHRLLEALRVANQYPTAIHATPVLPYARLAFAHTLHLLNKRQCVILRDYIHSKLGEYISTLKRGVQRRANRWQRSLCQRGPIL
ncbi:unnamed protein product [Coregonus sp. 'balchen']|nr:unnamed protein product [Coregonus sp. 'balchen']